MITSDAATPHPLQHFKSRAMHLPDRGPPVGQPRFNLMRATLSIMTLDPMFEPNPNLKGSYHRRLQDIRDALDKFEVAKLPPNAPAQFVAYYFGVEKLAKTIVGINKRQPPEAAFDLHVGVRLQATKDAAHSMKLRIFDVELDALFSNEKPTSAIRIRNGLSHDFGLTRVLQLRQQAPRLVPIMVAFIEDIDLVLNHLRRLWADQNKP